MVVRDGKRVALGMSGGVDSSVSVDVLQRCGYEVVGVTCVFQEGIASQEAVLGAREVCERMGIEHRTLDCTERFDAQVISPFVRDYARALTPSPCVVCNARCKIPALLEAATEYGCDYVATGHYARVGRMEDTGRFAVMRALDHRKDQSYMLCQLAQYQLARLILPLGGMTKLEVRAIASDLGLTVADAPESQDICFAPQGYRALLKERGAESLPGEIVDVRGRVLGRHSGLADYTIGQRKGIGVAGPEPYYVVEKRSAENELVIGTKEESLIRGFSVANMNWQALAEPAGPLDAMVKLRYRSEPCPCIIAPMDNLRAYVELRSPQLPTAPGQYAVFYQGATVLGGGMIEEVGQ